MNALRLFFVLCISILIASPAIAAKPDPRYASLVIDADTGRVIHAENANARRYPASLTKVMTLYLTFEALKKGELTLDSELTASKKAASMPQTNLSLRTGSKLTVRKAIEALVVRSANDVAVVLGERLGKTEWGFGLKMTSKARELGMTNTVFRNASGLPDSKQYTTARDLAVLAIAIRQHFPEYFPFFKTRSFSYNGRTYNSHNNAMPRIAGADGLKTGYINASGFNLITTVNRKGHHMVGVVMGGRTSRSRDDHMVALIEQSYAKLNNGKPMPQFAKVVPVPMPKPGSGAMAAEPITVAAAEVAPAAVATPVVAAAAVAPRIAPASLAPVNLAEARVAKSALRGQFHPVSYTTTTPPVSNSAKQWGIQVGAYGKQRDAMMAAANATNLAKSELGNSRILVSDSKNPGGQNIHRARLGNLSEDEARQACRTLISKNESCFVFRNDSTLSRL